MSTSVESAMDRLLGNPTTCPHGNPIPGSDYVEPTAVPVVVDRRRPAVHDQPDPRGARVHTGTARVPRSIRARPGHERHGHRRVSPDGTLTVEIGGHHVGVGAFASARILVSV